VKVLNVGGGGSRELPPQYDGWTHHILDIDPAVKPDVCCDALEMKKLPAGSYDAIFCSHNLEHFYQHDVPTVLNGFMHVLKPNGTVEVHVPNLNNLIDSMTKGTKRKDINDTWYNAPSGPVTFHDVLYGWSQAMKKGNLFYAHKCGFTAKSLHKALANAGFIKIEVFEQDSNLMATAEKTSC
jgi:ubiquinone/menaquinone biosynthesis C-methylase UbiE